MTHSNAQPARPTRHMWPTRPARLRTRGFSLAELMIAMVILGLGLLFIAAALPVGLEYTRQTVDMANADAAGDYALEQLESCLRTSKNLYDVGVATAAPTSGAEASVRLDNIFRPREWDPTVQPNAPRGTYLLKQKYEPLFKVRPLVMGNVRFEAVPETFPLEIVDDVELIITEYRQALSLPTTSWESDAPFTGQAGLSLVLNQVIPGLARTYPAQEAVTTYDVVNFFNNNVEYYAYQSRYKALTVPQYNRERKKCMDSRIAWTAFYRRVSHDEPGANGIFDATTPSDDVINNPLLYEIIIVVTQRPTERHRFPRQDLWTRSDDLDNFMEPWAGMPDTPPADDNPAALSYAAGTDRLAPMPWLVIFDSGAATAPLPILTPGADTYNSMDPTRTLSSNFNDSPTLTFKCTEELSVLLPVGSVLIPAWNDNYPQDGAGGNVPRRAGFVPHSPKSLPIYEVLERPDDETVLVKNDGLYPWVASVNATDTQAFPVWIIPPSFVERDREGQPIYEDQSPILKVIRRTVTLPESAR